MTALQELRATLPKRASRWFLGSAVFGNAWFRVDAFGEVVATGFESLSEGRQLQLREALQGAVDVKAFAVTYRIPPTVLVPGGIPVVIQHAWGDSPREAFEAADRGLVAGGWELVGGVPEIPA